MDSTLLAKPVLGLPEWTTLPDEELIARIAAPDNRRRAAATLRSMTPDAHWTDLILRRLEGETDYLDIRSVLAWLAEAIQPRTYLEIGVRRGFSSAMVASRAPDVNLYAFDLWIKDYANSPNPGPDFVAQELRRVGHRGQCRFVSGDSHRTVPEFLRSPRTFLGHFQRWLAGRPARPDAFDLITVDGDHTLVGALDDLRNVMDACRVGGAVVFDDIAPDVPAEAIRAELGPDPNGHGSLLGVWHAIQREFPQFRYVDYVDQAPGVAFAIRMS